jgi:hypothetical protein
VAFGRELKAETDAQVGSRPPDGESFRFWQELVPASKERHIFFAPRGIGLSAWTGNEKKQIQIRRRFMLLGQTLDGMRVWDIRRALQAVAAISPTQKISLEISAADSMGVNVLYASLFERNVSALNLSALPGSHREPTAPDYLGVMRHLDIPQALVMAAERQNLVLSGTTAEKWEFPMAVAKQLGWPGRISLSTAR